jgi:hypothetical protein
MHKDRLGKPHRPPVAKIPFSGLQRRLVHPTWFQVTDY